MALAGLLPMEPVELSEPLDLSATVAAPSMELDEEVRRICYRSKLGDGVQTQ